MTGPNSFGAFMQNSGFAAVPSPDIPYPGSDHYFTGGCIINSIIYSMKQTASWCDPEMRESQPRVNKMLI